VFIHALFQAAERFTDFRLLVRRYLGPMRRCRPQRTYVLPERHMRVPVQLLLAVQVDSGDPRTFHSMTSSDGIQSLGLFEFYAHPSTTFSSSGLIMIGRRYFFPTYLLFLFNFATIALTFVLLVWSSFVPSTTRFAVHPRKIKCLQQNTACSPTSLTQPVLISRSPPSNLSARR
jgi:hypothetical protein